MDLHTQCCLATYYHRIEDLDLYYFFLGKVFELSFASLPKNQKPQALASILRNISLSLLNSLKPLKTVY
ncbi:hypothetical protein IQ22_03065 [Pseudomonas duriflava]|uniref:Uncharacterized protein n=1 Tax=Pseudomonas duriflava TaxID=459528 RepID=A0A562Q7I7_9PSED|nr:hypothetical protein IQ22_03065 [Pseudomonas duriflava]